MTKQYRVTPLKNKSAYYRLEIYRKNRDGRLSWVNIDECWRWAQGFLSEDEDVIPYDGECEINCAVDRGWGCEFEDQISCEFEFSDDISEDERDEIKACYREEGHSWVHDGDHSWEYEYDSLKVVGPYKVDLVNFSTQEVISEDVRFPLKQENTISKKPWPFPTK
jgi:hypothetical protein